MSIDFLPRSPGIYCIRNILAGDCYVGQTANIRSRVLSHFFLLHKGSHYQKKLQLAFNKHMRHFIAEVLVEMPENMDLKSERGRNWLDVQENFFYETFKPSLNGYRPPHPKCDNLLAANETRWHHPWFVGEDNYAARYADGRLILTR